MAEWVAAKSIKGLFPEGTADGPPPTPATTSMTPTGPANRQPSYAMHVGRTVGKLNRGVLWLAGNGGILALVFIGVVLLPQIPGFAKARFDLHSLESTKRWALQQYLALLHLRREGNTFRVAEATKELEGVLRANEGKTVHWRIAVAGVGYGTKAVAAPPRADEQNTAATGAGEGFVFLQSSYSEQVEELRFNPGGESAGYMAIGCEEDLGVGSTGMSGWMGSMLSNPMNIPSAINGIPCRVTKVQIGRHIAPALAAKLKTATTLRCRPPLAKPAFHTIAFAYGLDNVAVSE